MMAIFEIINTTDSLIQLVTYFMSGTVRYTCTILLGKTAEGGSAVD